MSKFLKKFGQDFTLDDFSDRFAKLLQGADATKCGVPRPVEFTALSPLRLCGDEVLILPDRTPYGPMYISRLRRS